MPEAKKPIIALVLGGGAARGWAHIGVIHELAEMGIRPDMVVGTSVGAVVGGAYASGNLGQFEEWISGLGRVDIRGNTKTEDQVIVMTPWLLLPGAFIVVTVIAFNLLGDGLRDAADPYSNLNKS